MEKKQIDWENLGFGYVQTEQRYVSNYKDGKWDARAQHLAKSNIVRKSIFNETKA